MFLIADLSNDMAKRIFPVEMGIFLQASDQIFREESAYAHACYKRCKFLQLKSDSFSNLKTLFNLSHIFLFKQKDGCCNYNCI
jgi:hypothetical protein